MTEKLREHQGYLIGLFVTAFVGAMALQLTQPTNNFPVVVDILLTSLAVVLLTSLLSGLIRGVVWIFTRNFSFTKLVRTTIVIALIWTLTVLISLITNLR